MSTFPHFRMANFQGSDFKSTGVSQSKNESGLNEYAGSLFDPSLTWKDIKWLRSVTKLPIVIKGVLSGIVPITLIEKDKFVVKSVKIISNFYGASCTLMFGHVILALKFTTR